MTKSEEPDDEFESFQKRGTKERANWYSETLERIAGEQIEPSMGGSETMFLANEVRIAFVNGCYIATILLCAAIVEQELFAGLVSRDIYESTEKVYLGTMVSKSEELGMLTSEEADAVNELNSNRVSFFHYRDFSHPDAPFAEVFQKQDEPYSPYEEYENRARHAIETWLKIAIKPWTEWTDLDAESG